MNSSLLNVINFRNFLQFKVLFISLLFSLNLVAAESQPRPASTVMNAADPYEAYNRKMFAFNMAFNDTVGKPIANVYNSSVPQPARTGVSNFFDNLGTPLSAINCFLQGR